MELHGREFDTKDAAVAYVHQYARENGFALSEGRKRLDKKGNLRRADFRCDKGSKVRGHGVVRNSASRMTECPYDLRILRVLDSNRWRIDVVDSTHNHSLSETPSQHTRYRKPTEEQKQLIGELSAAGVPPRMVVSSLQAKSSGNTLITPAEIYNQKKKLRKERFSTLTPIEVLVKEFEEDDTWAANYTTDPERHVNYLFFAYKPAIDLAQRFHDVLLIDATYRTNRYNMPLLHFMGVTSIGTSFTIAWCFMAQETETQYRKALSDFKELVIGDYNITIEAFITDEEDALKNAILAIYPGVPQLLCFWHVEKRVLEKAKSLWRVNNVDEATNKANKEKKQEFMAAWKQVLIAKRSFDRSINPPY